MLNGNISVRFLQTFAAHQMLHLLPELRIPGVNFLPLRFSKVVAIVE